MLRRLKDQLDAVIDLTTVLMVGVVFAALVVMAYIIWTLDDMLVPEYPGSTAAANASWNATYGQIYNSSKNITGGFDDAVNLLLVAITIFILAIAISALLMLRGR